MVELAHPDSQQLPHASTLSVHRLFSAFSSFRFHPLLCSRSTSLQWSLARSLSTSEGRGDQRRKLLAVDRVPSASVRPLIFRVRRSTHGHSWSLSCFCWDSEIEIAAVARGPKEGRNDLDWCLLSLAALASHLGLSNIRKPPHHIGLKESVV